MIIICLHTIIWFHIIFSNTNNIPTNQFIDRTLTGSITPGQGGSGSNYIEVALHTSKISRTVAPSSNAV